MRDKDWLAAAAIATVLFLTIAFSTRMIYSERSGSGMYATPLELVGLAAVCFGGAFVVLWAMRQVKTPSSE